MTDAALPADNSYTELSANNPIQRAERAPNRDRPAAFSTAFDRRTLFYDCFRHADGQRILLVGPPAMNLAGEFRRARYRARPGGEQLKARYFASLSTMVTELSGAPAGTTALEISLANETFLVTVQPNSSEALRGRRLLFSINRDNDLAWIREWANFHARIHGTDAVVLFDNGSSRYAPREILDTLLSVPGIAQAAVPVWPYSFGPFDPAVKANPYWARFLQIGSMSVMLRRYGEAAFGLLDCDIDELAGTRSGRSIYDLAHDSQGGLVVFRGVWIEATGAGTAHRDFSRRLAAPEAALSSQRKWALDPSRDWVRKLSVHPYWHWVEGRPLLAKSMPADALYWHFKAINTNWKQQRTIAPAADAATEPDTLLTTLFERLSV